MKIAISGKGGVGKTTLSAFLCKWFGDQGRTVLAIDADGTRRRTKRRSQRAQQRRLAGAARADHGHGFAALDREVSDLESDGLAINDPEVAKPKLRAGPR